MGFAVQKSNGGIHPLTYPTVRTLAILMAPAAALALVHWLAASGASLPPPLLGLELYGPYAAISLAGFMSLWFNRGRPFLALLCLAIAYLFYVLVLGGGIDSDLAGHSYTLLCVLVPLNLVALTLLPERGLFNPFGFRRLLIVVVQVAAVVLLLRAGFTHVADWLRGPLPELAWLQAAPIPPRVLPIILLGVVLAAIPALLRDAPIEGALCGAIIAFALACYSAERPADFGLLVSTAALLIMIGVLQDSYRMAFRDELTGLPSRRALNERMMSLGHRFTIAMLDIDHFKRFNDTYGHEVGDHVLKMVAAKLGQVRAGGRAFRYGGEEFALVFPNRSARRVLRELEALRTRVADHRLALRSPQRPAEARAGRNLRAAGGIKHGVSLTVSIGLAECNDKQHTPEQVLRAADRALYRAKNKGRNRVSR